MSAVLVMGAALPSHLVYKAASSHCQIFILWTVIPLTMVCQHMAVKCCPSQGFTHQLIFNHSNQRCHRYPPILSAPMEMTLWWEYNVISPYVDREEHLLQVTQHMQIPLSYADAVIGISGSSISYIRRASGATITIQETRGVPGEMTVEINGSASQVQTAQQLIQACYHSLYYFLWWEMTNWGSVWSLDFTIIAWYIKWFYYTIFIFYLLWWGFSNFLTAIIHCPLDLLLSYINCRISWLKLGDPPRTQLPIMIRATIRTIHRDLRMGLLPLQILGMVVAMVLFLGLIMGIDPVNRWWGKIIGYNRWGGGSCLRQEFDMCRSLLRWGGGGELNIDKIIGVSCLLGDFLPVWQCSVILLSLVKFTLLWVKLILGWCMISLSSSLFLTSMKADCDKFQGNGWVDDKICRPAELVSVWL